MLFIIIKICVIYFIGKTYFDLAVYHKKNGWLFAAFGIVSFFAGTVLFGILFFLSADILKMSLLVDLNAPALNFMSLILSLLVCWGFYKFLYTSWKNKKMLEDTDILDEDMV